MKREEIEMAVVFVFAFIEELFQSVVALIKLLYWLTGKKYTGVIRSQLEDPDKEETANRGKTKYIYVV